MPVTSAEHDVIGDERELQALHSKQNDPLPFRESQALDADFADDAVDDFIFVGQIAELERKYGARPDERRAETRPEAEKEHAAAMITAERLHRGVVDHARRFAQRAREVEAKPTFSKMARLFRDSTILYD